ncbi:serine/threonine protein kinase [Trichocoleus sp. FACHB-591]|uniref:serine/threonine protein kinase n=1 Tax=Trichocoleus sp. FACHB-591 TaxID=2692872 RepID=UPI0016871986|nr:protein kinase [Trichocoleus sp. FACHB-591]MBD2097118.1 serine/threonine protein kinase [Trichocoleus sp. FACHB-591]
MQPSLSLGTILPGRYHLIDLLEQGTYLAEDQTRFNELYLLQEFRLRHPGAYSLEVIRGVFQQEAAILYELQHPQIPRFRGIIPYADRLFVVQEYVEGVTCRDWLKERLTQHQVFSEAEVMQLFWHVLPVLLHIHSRGIIHGNLSPASILIRQRDGVPMLTHFGLIQEIATDLELYYPGPKKHLSKLGYAPKEQLQSDKVYRNSDLYALAATAVVLLTGQEPQTLYNPRRQLWYWEPWATVSPGLAQILNRMLSAKPQNRYGSAGKVIRALQALLAQPAYIPPTAALALAPQHNNPPPVVADSPVVEPELELAAELEPQLNLEAELEPAPKPQPVVALEPEQVEPESDITWMGSALAVAALGLTLLVLGLLAGAAWRSLRQMQQAQQDSSSSATVVQAAAQSRTAKGSAAASTTPKSENGTHAALRDRRRRLNISYDLFVDLVDTVFYSEHSELDNRRLSGDSDDRALRREWNATAEKLLNKLEPLSEESRNRLGRYSQQDYDQWVMELERQHLSRPTFAQLVDAKFYRLFPEQQERYLDPNTFGQVWYAIAAETFQAIQAGTAFSPLQLGPKNPSQTLTATLKPGEGKVYVANLSQGQTIRVALQSPNQGTRLSIYSPERRSAAAQALINDTPKTSWSGTLPRPGYYEIVILSNSPDIVRYQLNLTLQSQTPTTPNEPSFDG